ncbi:MAG: prepilin peptidase [Candidatus Dependentiae bacterium]|nr:prepilin peptidase [Candidatus Dependentiae bacterium]
MAILAFLIFLAWGSYLNSLGYRLLNLEHFLKARSFCPSCKNMIFWYDNIPVYSWIQLKGRCRFCKNKISWLYPFIELISVGFLLSLWITVPLQYFPAYFIFFSALIITIRTDFDEMLISRFVTLYLIPFGLVAAIVHRLPLTPALSVVGSIFGYCILWTAKKISFQIKKQDGLGQGDLELLAFIGAFTGPFGCWVTLLIGSVVGSFASLIYMAITRQRITIIPFGPFLALGAMLFVLFQKFFFQYFFAI